MQDPVAPAVTPSAGFGCHLESDSKFAASRLN